MHLLCHSKCGGEGVELAPCAVEETEAIVGFHRIVREEGLHRVEPPPLRSKFTQTVVVPMVVYEIVIEAAGLG